MLLLLLIKCLCQADPKGTSKKAAENRDDDHVASGLDMFGVIKPWAAVVDVLVVHERTRERAHAQQYAVPGIPCQRLPLALPFFFIRLGSALTLATVS